MDDKSDGSPADQKTVSKELAREFKWVEFAQIASNIILAIVGIFALCIYNGQLKVMRGQLGEIAKQFPEIQKSASAAKAASDAATKAADIADATLRSSQQSFILDQRPYMPTTLRLRLPALAVELPGYF